MLVRGAECPLLPGCNAQHLPASDWEKAEQGAWEGWLCVCVGGCACMHVCARVCISMCMLCSRQQESGCAQECVGVLGKECFFISEAH